MDATLEFPSFDDHLPGLNQFILGLVEEYNAGKIKSWDNLKKRVRSFFTPERMEQMESIVPGWKKMASYSEGITLTHVMCVFLGLFMLPEFQALSPNQKQLAKWIVLFHDIDKFHVRGKKDTMHAFNSAVVSANVMPGLGFHITCEYHPLINSWSGFTRQAFIPTGVEASPKPDNQKMPEILSGIDQLFGENTPASLITKTVLLHISLDVDKHYPTPAPLTEDEIQRFINPSLLSLLKVMMLSDNEGWAMFHPEGKARQREETLEAFANIELLMNKERA